MAETRTGALALESFDSGHFERVAHGKTTLALGPGLSRDAEAAQFAQFVVKRTSGPLVVDADGLNAFEHRRAELNGAGRVLIVTPHPGEMARLTGFSIQQIQDDRVRIARYFARDHQCIVVLKGHRTVVAAPDTAAWLCGTGNPGMATGGTGDVLTGMIAGIVAQYPADPMAATCAAVYLHGMAGDAARDRFGEQAMIATDVLANVGEAIRNTREAVRAKFVRVA